MFQIAAENSNVFWAFFEFFHMMYLFLYPIYFSKIFLLKQRKTIILLDRLNRFIADPHLKFWEKIEDNVEFVLSSASVSYFGHNLLLKIPIDLELMFFWKEIQFSITLIEIEKFKFQCLPGQKCDSNCCWR